MGTCMHIAHLDLKWSVCQACAYRCVIVYLHKAYENVYHTDIYDILSLIFINFVAGRIGSRGKVSFLLFFSEMSQEQIFKICSYLLFIVHCTPRRIRIHL